MLHGKPPAGGQRNRPCPQIFAGKPPIGAALQAWRHDDAAAVDAAILLHEYGIGARRHRRAGKDADRLAGLTRMRRGMTGGDAIDDGEALVALGRKIVAAHRVTVDGGIIERRHIDRRDDIFGEHAAQRFAQRHGLAAVDRRHPLGNQALGFSNRKQRAVKGEAIVA